MSLIGFHLPDSAIAIQSLPLNTPVAISDTKSRHAETVLEIVSLVSATIYDTPKLI